MARERTAGAPIGAVLAIVGGALLAIGSFLTWAEVSGGGQTVAAKGTDGSDGYITLVLGIVAIGCGIVLMRGARRALAIIVIVAGIIGAAVGLYDALTAKDRVLDDAAEELAPGFGVSTEEMREVLDAAIDSGQLGLSISIGLYVVIAGGVIAIVGGALSTRVEAGDGVPVGAEPAAAGFAAVGATAPAEPAGSTPPPPPADSPPTPDPSPPPPPADGGGV
ncbi:MAG TPA: hypothetical protein VIC58_01540 [Actinomycetota bacterium]|jgi:hypothetical protein